MGVDFDKFKDEYELFSRYIKQYGLLRASEMMFERAEKSGRMGLINTNNHHEAELEYDTFRSRLIQYGKIKPGQDLEDCDELTEEEKREWKEYRNAGKSVQ